MNAITKRIAEIENELKGNQWPDFWRPILARWLVWLGCSWAVGSVLVFAPLIARLVKKLF